MATYQLAGMPSMMMANQNAPTSHVPAPVRYANDTPGLTVLQGLQGVAHIHQQAQQAQALQQYQQSFGKALANDDRESMKQLHAANPQFFEQTQKGLGLIDAERNQHIGQAALALRRASQQGEDALSHALQAHAGALAYLNLTPQEIFDSYKKNPGQFEQTTHLLGMHALTPEKYFDVQDKLAVRQETARNNDMTDNRARAGLQQAAEFHRDNMGMRLKELSQKLTASGTPDIKTIQGLNSDITGFQKNYTAVKNAAASLSALERVNTGAAQLGIIFNYMKSLDPQSVVREGEQVQVLRSDGVWGQLRGYVDQLNNGTGLSANARSNIVQAAKINANTLGQAYNQQVDEYLSTFGETLPAALKTRLENRKAKIADMSETQNTEVRTPARQAPPEAIELLKSNPAFSAQFHAKYGYLP